MKTKIPGLRFKRARALVQGASRARILVVGDVMLDQFLWGKVGRISPEAPVPVVEFERESFMPGGAANVAGNLTALNAKVELFGVTGRDEARGQLLRLLAESQVSCGGLIECRSRHTSIKTRIIAHRQQVVRVDRESRGEIGEPTASRLLAAIRARIRTADAVIVEDYGKGAVTQEVLDELKQLCRERGIWLSLDPKPVHQLDLAGVSLITPNRKEAFELAGLADRSSGCPPQEDVPLKKVAESLLAKLQPALLLITLGDHGMLLCQRDQRPWLIPTVARDVFDVSGAGDTVIASFTLAIVAGASPVEAAIFSNHAAGVVVGKVGTAIVTPQELLESFKHR